MDKNEPKKKVLMVYTSYQTRDNYYFIKTKEYIQNTLLKTEVKPDYDEIQLHERSEKSKFMDGKRLKDEFLYNHENTYDCVIFYDNSFGYHDFTINLDIEPQITENFKIDFKSISRIIKNNGHVMFIVKGEDLERGKVKGLTYENIKEENERRGRNILIISGKINGILFPELDLFQENDKKIKHYLELFHNNPKDSESYDKRNGKRDGNIDFFGAIIKKEKESLLTTEGKETGVEEREKERVRLAEAEKERLAEAKKERLAEFDKKSRLLNTIFLETRGTAIKYKDQLLETNIFANDADFTNYLKDFVDGRRRKKIKSKSRRKSVRKNRKSVRKSVRKNKKINKERK